MSSEDWFLEIWKKVMQRDPTTEEKKNIDKALEMGKVFRESGLWNELLEKYGENRSTRIWELLIAIYNHDDFRAYALFEALENNLP